jgi:hypothetical protein
MFSSCASLRTVQCPTVCCGTVGFRENIYTRPQWALKSLLKHIRESPTKTFVVHLTEVTDGVFQEALISLLRSQKIPSTDLQWSPVVLYIQCDCATQDHSCNCEKCLDRKPEEKRCRNPGAFYYLPTKAEFNHLRDTLRTEREDHEKPELIFKKFCSNPGCFKNAVCVCAACKTLYYCSKECQKTHWKAEHKAAHAN